MKKVGVLMDDGEGYYKKLCEKAEHDFLCAFTKCDCPAFLTKREKRLGESTPFWGGEGLLPAIKSKAAIVCS